MLVNSKIEIKSGFDPPFVNDFVILLKIFAAIGPKLSPILGANLQCIMGQQRICPCKKLIADVHFSYNMI